MFSSSQSSALGDRRPGEHDPKARSNEPPLPGEARGCAPRSVRSRWGLVGDLRQYYPSVLELPSPDVHRHRGPRIRTSVQPRSRRKAVLHRVCLDACFVEAAGQKVGFDVVPGPSKLHPTRAAAAASSGGGWRRDIESCAHAVAYRTPKILRAITTLWIWLVPS
jgi:hypothetical protein